MTEKYSVRMKYRIFRFFAKPVFRLLFLALAHVTVTGKENIPVGKAYMVAANHVSLYDPPLVLALWPEMLEAMGAADIWKKTGQSTLVEYYGGIKVHRGEYDRKLIDMVVNILKSGYPMVIAPEGGRTHQPGMREAKQGIAFILEMAQVPVVPVGVVGTTDDFAEKAFSFKKPKIEMHIGKPFHLPPIEGKGAERREARQRNTDLVMGHIAALLPEEYRGVYADRVITQDEENG
jgi:1-acyl-sn-glycerol-3-phosphate acyltransferase